MGINYRVATVRKDAFIFMAVDFNFEFNHGLNLFNLNADIRHAVALLTLHGHALCMLHWVTGQINFLAGLFVDGDKMVKAGF